MSAHNIYGFNGTEAACTCSPRIWRPSADFMAHAARAAEAEVEERIRAACLTLPAGLIGLVDRHGEKVWELMHALYPQSARAAERALVGGIIDVELIHAPRLIHPLREDGSLDESVALHTYCDECTPDATVSMIEDAEWNEDWPIVEHPCRTVNFLRAALRPEAATTEGVVCPACGLVVGVPDGCLPSSCSAWKEIPWPAAARPSSTRGGDDSE